MTLSFILQQDDDDDDDCVVGYQLGVVVKLIVLLG
jgi:hypothetical protein